MSFTKVDEREKQAALEEEQARLKALKVVMLFEETLHAQCVCFCSVSVVRMFELDCCHSGAKAQGALQEALLRHYRHITGFHHRGHYQHSTSY